MFTIFFNFSRGDKMSEQPPGLKTSVQEPSTAEDNPPAFVHGERSPAINPIPLITDSTVSDVQSQLFENYQPSAFLSGC